LWHAILPGGTFEIVARSLHKAGQLRIEAEASGHRHHDEKSTMAHANANRPWELCQSVFMQLLEKCQVETAARSRRKRMFRFKNKMVSLDGSIIELSAIVFDWV
jgi:hypothetical protein